MTNDRLRRAYDYYLDHPEDHRTNQWRYYEAQFTSRMAQSDVRVVVVGAIAIASLIQYLSRRALYLQVRQPLDEDQTADSGTTSKPRYNMTKIQRGGAGAAVHWSLHGWVSSVWQTCKHTGSNPWLGKEFRIMGYGFAGVLQGSA